MKVIVSLLITVMLMVTVCAADTSFNYPVGKTQDTDVAIYDYLTVDKITEDVSLKENEGYILSMPICVDTDGDAYQFAVLYAPTIDTPVAAYTFRTGDTRGVTGYFKPGDKVRIDRSESYWKMEKV